MKYLLDTQAFLDGLLKVTPFSKKVQTRLDDPNCELFLSLASVWEMVIKTSLGKLKIPMPLEVLLKEARSQLGVQLLPIDLASILHVSKLELSEHKDPFDRLIAAQCLEHDCTLVASDAAFDQYGVNRVW